MVRGSLALLYTNLTAETGPEVRTTLAAWHCKHTAKPDSTWGGLRGTDGVVTIPTSLWEPARNLTGHRGQNSSKPETTNIRLNPTVVKTPDKKQQLSSHWKRGTIFHLLGRTVWTTSLNTKKGVQTPSTLKQNTRLPFYHCPQANNL